MPPEWPGIKAINKMSRVRLVTKHLLDVPSLKQSSYEVMNSGKTAPQTPRKMKKNYHPVVNIQYMQEFYTAERAGINILI